MSPSLRGRRSTVAILGVLALLTAVLATPAGAAATPVDVSGPVDGAGPGVAATPSTNIIAGQLVAVTTENLPDATEAAAWTDDGDFSDDNPTVGGETGTYGGSVTVALCGNADTAGTPLGIAFDPALHCDGGDARSSTFLVTTTATAGAISAVALTRDGQGQFDFDDDADPVTPPVPASAGIGSAEATCLPGAGSCQFYVTDGASTFWGLATFDVVPAPSLSLDSVTGQLAGAQAARGGNDLVVSGTDWDPASALAAALCDAADPLTCDASSSTAGLTVDAGGLLSGSVPVTALNTVGLRVLKITQASNGGEALLPIVILGPRVITIDPSSGGASTAVNITGSGFDPLQPVTVTGSDGVNPTSDVGSAVVDSVGGLTGSILVQSPATVSIVVTEDDNPTSEGASAAFDFTLQQQVGQVVINGDALTLTQAGDQIAMSEVTLSTTSAQQSSGVINTVTVLDSRGTLTGWSVTATATDWVDIAEPDPTNPAPNHWIPAANLTWLPSCGPAAGSTADPAEVTAGPAASLDPVTAATLCAAPPGGGGGAWEANAILVLNVPSSIAAATYQGTLTIVAT